MPRTARTLSTDSSIFHVCNRGNDGKPIFLSDADHREFMLSLIRAGSDIHADIHHFVLIPNHYHIILKLQNGSHLSAYMKILNQRYSLYHKATYGHIGHLWQGRFKHKTIQNDGYLLTAGIYVELNPVRAGLVSRPEDYPWSSFTHYASSKDNPIITESPAYLALGKTKAQRQRAYRSTASSWLEKDSSKERAKK